jgi:Skp family chaperone for outer membrane proteins
LVFNEIQTFAREENYDLLLIEGVAHASARVDVTDRILARLQARAQSGSN